MALGSPSGGPLISPVTTNLLLGCMAAEAMRGWAASERTQRILLSFGELRRAAAG